MMARRKENPNIIKLPVSPSVPLSPRTHVSSDEQAMDRLGDMTYSMYLLLSEAEGYLASMVDFTTEFADHIEWTGAPTPSLDYMVRNNQEIHAELRRLQGILYEAYSREIPDIEKRQGGAKPNPTKKKAAKTNPAKTASKRRCMR